MPISALEHALAQLRAAPLGPQRFGRIRSVVGLLVEATGLEVALGELCYLHETRIPGGRRVKAEVVGVRGETTVLIPLEETVGLRAGGLVEPAQLPLTISVGAGLLGRVIDANGRPIDGKGPLRLDARQPVHCDPPSPLARRLIQEPLPTGVRAIDAMLTLGKGQRVGIFAGSGVGKSTLLGMIAHRAQADVNVIALIGERGREVREFVEDTLGEDDLKRSVVVAVTGDQAAMSRVKGASVAMAIAEHFRDAGQDVLLMMDSVTRVAMAQREIGLAVGEPPTTRGYTPSVFALLPRLLERAGPGAHGTITGIFTVLVDGGDMDEPVADATRGILDGHIVLSRTLAQAGHFPSIDVLQSVSRVMPRVATAEHQQTADEARRLLAAYAKVEDLLRVGAYERGQDRETDRAVAAHAPLMAFLRQRMDEAPPAGLASELRAVLDALSA
ncbi:MAG: FliI/YscN family ATPase [Rhodothermaceae bacterium]|nr:FliI/YscN family ATPase [Rhodothermaceae bacterium]